MRQSKYLNNLIEQDHRAIKRVVRPMLGSKSFHCARPIIAGIETMHMGKEGQLNFVKDRASFAADKFYSLAFRSQPPWDFFQPLSVIATEPSSPARK